MARGLSTLSEAKPGMSGAVIGRAEAQVMRLSAIYALLDKSALNSTGASSTRRWHCGVTANNPRGGYLELAPATGMRTRFCRSSTRSKWHDEDRNQRGRFQPARIQCRN